MPKSKKTDCPPGASYVEVEVAGEKYGTCMTTSMCADFDDIRDKLFPDYQTLKAKEDKTTADEAKLAGMEAVEAVVCVGVRKVDRPESPYATNEGCINCHILAMVDIMDKTLQKNVTPLENSMQSWGTSNRWGPTLAFNLNTITQRFISPLTHHDLRPFPTDKEKADKHAEQANETAKKTDDTNTPPAPASTVKVEKAADNLNRKIKTIQEAKTEFQENLKNYKLTGDARSDQIAHSKVISKLNELKASFESILGKHMKLSSGTGLGEKTECKIQ
jgi:hypothetical protein